jgi:hypothetical protein
LPQKCRGILDGTVCTRNTKQLTGLSCTMFDTVTGIEVPVFQLDRAFCYFQVIWL